MIVVKWRSMKNLSFFLCIFILASCSAQISSDSTKNEFDKKTETTLDVPTPVDEYFRLHAQDSIPSKSNGSVSNGTLVNGTLIPFSGPNYAYFDSTSYLSGRAFMHQHVAKTLLGSFSSLEILLPQRNFKVMECSNEHGGKMYPHRTHQNGTSVDLMMPKQKNGTPYYGLDDKGGNHYFLDFDDNGVYTKDPSISLDFDVLGQQLLELNKIAKKNGLKIKKVILKMELRDELYASKHGKELKASGIYITRNLTPIINMLHDDHFHVDFEIIH
jgi:penicillin-insensitive murein endopeptidase